MKNKLLLFCTLLFMKSFSQTITGAVQDDNGKPLFNASVLLLTTKDSSLVKGATTDTSGSFAFYNIPPGRYCLLTSGVGYKQAFSPAFTLQDGEGKHEMPVLIMRNETGQLKAVSVAARRPFMEQKTDRTIVNVAGSIIASGSTALEVLEKSPGITVDRQNDQISLRGREGVVVLIDGKQTFLSMPDVVALLRNMPSDNIDRIELVTNPSAKYDAAGNAGLIDIRLKKNNNVGTNGSVALTCGSGRYARERGSLQLNHRTATMNLFGSYNAFSEGGYWDFNIARVQGEGPDKNYISSLSYIRAKNKGQNSKAGLDYFISKHTTVGIVWTGLWNDGSEQSPAQVLFKHEKDGPVYLHTVSEKAISMHASNQLANVNFQHAFSKAGQSLSVDFDRGWFRRDYSNTLNTKTVVPFDPGEQPTGLLTFMPTTIDILTFKTDYTQAIGGAWKMEAGLKSSTVRSDNNVELLSGKNTDLQKDTGLSNHFLYKEHVNAAYVNFSGKPTPKLNIMFGLRAEHTRSEGSSLTQNNVVKRSYLDLFPSLFVTRTLNQKHSLLFSYSYRIDRPNYQSLNPARSYLDPYFYSAGNAFLQPQYTHSLELRHGYKEKVFTSLAASFITDLQFFVIQPLGEKISQRMPENIGSSQAYSLTVSLPVRISKVWTMQGTVLGTYSTFDYTYKGTPLHAQQIAGRLNAANLFAFGNGWTGELMGRLNTPTVYAFRRSPWLGSMDAGLQKTFNAKWKAKLSLQDILHTNFIRSRIDAPGFENYSRIAQDTRFCLLNITYSFGNQQLKGNRQRKTAAEDEVQRTN